MYKALLLPLDNNTGWVLVHPGHGGLASFSTIEQAQAWARAHQGTVSHATFHHPFHGDHRQVWFEIWPARKAA